MVVRAGLAENKELRKKAERLAAVEGGNMGDNKASNKGARTASGATTSVAPWLEWMRS